MAVVENDHPPRRALQPTGRMPRVRTSQCMRGAQLLSIPRDTHTEFLAFLDIVELCRVEVVCRSIRKHLGGDVTIADPAIFGAGLWRSVGARSFCGVELRTGADFHSFEERGCAQLPCPRDDICSGDLVTPSVSEGVCWKSVCKQFHAGAVSFKDMSSEFPFPTCCFRMDLLQNNPGQGVYVEFVTLEAVSGLLLGVGGGHLSANSLVFEPEQGRLRETFLAPRSASTLFGRFKTQLEDLMPPAGQQSRSGLCFDGWVGFYLSGSRIAFFRECRNEVGRKLALTKQGDSSCQASAFVPIPSWAKGQRLSVHVSSSRFTSPPLRIVRVGGSPPVWPRGPR